MKKMTEDLLNGRENWSDFEETISKLLEDRTVEIDEIEKCVDEFQAYFTRFLNNLVDSSVLLEMNADVKEKALAKQSLSHFMKDLPNTCDIKFPATTDHYDLYNFLFVDFCYTSLLDNYMYPGFPNNHTSIQESSNNYCYFWRASNGLTPRSRYSCSCFIRTSPCAGAFPGSR